MHHISVLLFAIFFGNVLGGVARRDQFDAGRPIDVVTGKGAPISGMMPAQSGHQILTSARRHE